MDLDFPNKPQEERAGEGEEEKKSSAAMLHP